MVWAKDVTAAIAKGKRPAPSRTRKLSPSAPMVLHPPGCGRVGRRRTTTQKWGAPSGFLIFCSRFHREVEPATTPRSGPASAGRGNDREDSGVTSSPDERPDRDGDEPVRKRPRTTSDNRVERGGSGRFGGSTGGDRRTGRSDARGGDRSTGGRRWSRDDRGAYGRSDRDAPRRRTGGDAVGRADQRSGDPSGTARRPRSEDGSPKGDRRSDHKTSRGGADRRTSGRRDSNQRDTQPRATGQRDTARRDARRRDAGQGEATPRDAGRRNVGQRDTARRDAGQRDTARRDAGQRDTARRDAGQRDTARRETGRRDTGRGQVARGQGAERRGGAQSGRAPQRTGPVRRSGGEPPEELTSREPVVDQGPPIPDEVVATDLHPDVRSELRALSKFTAETVARRLVMTGELLDEDPEEALAHALAARRPASRIAVVREAVGLAAYRAGDWKLAISELRAYQRISGRQGHLALIADCERALGRPERAIDIYRAVDARQLDRDDLTELLIVAAGARRDLGQIEAALAMLQVPGLRSRSHESWVARLRYAYADLLAASGRTDEAREWLHRAVDVDPEGTTGAAERLLELDGVVLTDDTDDTDESDGEESPNGEGRVDGEVSDGEVSDGEVS